MLRIFMAQAGYFIFRRLKMDIGYQNDIHIKPLFNFMNFSTLLIQQVSGHLDGQLNMQGAGVLLHDLFLNDTQNVQGGRIGTADIARTVTAWT